MTHSEYITLEDHYDDRCCINRCINDYDTYDETLPCYSKHNIGYILSSILWGVAICSGVIGALIVLGYLFYCLYGTDAATQNNGNPGNNNSGVAFLVQITFQYLLTGILTIICWFLSAALFIGVVLGILLPCSLIIENTDMRRCLSFDHHHVSRQQGYHTVVVFFIVLIIGSVPYTVFAIPASALLLPVGSISRHHQESCIHYTGHFMNIRCFMEGLAMHFVFFMGISIMDMLVWCCCCGNNTYYCCYLRPYKNTEVENNSMLNNSNITYADDLEHAPLLSRV